MQAPGGVLVDHEESAARRGGVPRQRAGRLGGALERALGAIGREGIGLGSGHEGKCGQIGAEKSLTLRETPARAAAPPLSLRAPTLRYI